MQNKIFKQLAANAKMSYVRIHQNIRENMDDPAEITNYSATPDELCLFAESIVKYCAELAQKHQVNDASLTTAESLMCVSEYIYTKFGMKS